MSRPYDFPCPADTILLADAPYLSSPFPPGSTFGAGWPMPSGCHFVGSARRRGMSPPRGWDSSKPSGLVKGAFPPGQEHRLVAEGNPGSGETVAGLGQLEGDLVGVVDVDVEPDRVKLLEHVAQVVVDPHRHKDGDAGSDPDDLGVFDLAQGPHP